MLHRWRFIAGAVLVFSTTSATAEEFNRKLFSLSGYGTLGAVHSSEKNADFTSSILKPHGAGYSHDWSFEVDSRLALQLDAQFTRDLSGVLQTVIEQGPDNSYKPRMEWANLKYEFTPDLSVRAGRIALSGFLMSEYQKVGYAMPWLRPPGLYTLYPISSNDGVDVIHRMYFGETLSTVQSYFGQKDTDLPVYDGNSGGSISKGRDSFGVVHTVENGRLTTRAAYHQGRLTVAAAKPLFDAFRMFGAPGAAIAERYELDNTPYWLVSVGLNYDQGTWFATGELAKLKTNSLLGDRTNWYLGGGYRINGFTPYLIYSRGKPDSASSDPGLPTTGLPPRTAVLARELNDVLNQVLNALAARQTTIALGMRWDFMKNAALKVQYDRLHLGPDSAGPLINVQPAFDRGEKVHLLSVAVDFVF